LLSQVLQRFEVVHDVGERCAYSFSATNRREIRNFFTAADGQCEKTVTDPGLFDLHVVWNVFNEFMNGWLVLLTGGETRSVQEIHNRQLLQGGDILHGFSQRDESVGEAVSGRRDGAGKLRSWRESWTRLAGRGVIASLKHLAEALRIALTPTASDRCVVVHKNVWTVRDRLTLELGVDENKKIRDIGSAPGRDIPRYRR